MSCVSLDTTQPKILGKLVEAGNAVTLCCNKNKFRGQLIILSVNLRIVSLFHRIAYFNT